jgi:hypothetical protein
MKNYFTGGKYIMTKSRKLRLAVINILLALSLVLPTLPVFAFVAPAANDIAVETQSVIGGINIGYTPAQVDAMAIDPQTWRLPHDTRFNPIEVWDGADGTVMLNASPDWDGYESFRPHPVVDWEKVRNRVPGYPQPQFPTGMRPRLMRGAIFMVEFPDQNMIAGWEKGSETMGNPQHEGRRTCGSPARFLARILE